MRFGGAPARRSHLREQVASDRHLVRAEREREHAVAVVQRLLQGLRRTKSKAGPASKAATECDTHSTSPAQPGRGGLTHERRGPKSAPRAHQAGTAPASRRKKSLPGANRPRTGTLLPACRGSRCRRPGTSNGTGWAQMRPRSSSGCNPRQQRVQSTTANTNLLRFR